jgi:hypothetical protein
MKALADKTWLPFLILILSLAAGCRQSSYEMMKSYIDEIKVIDTHEHQGMPWKKKYHCFDMGLYLHADLISAGMPEYPDSMERVHDAGEFWEHTQSYLRFCRGTSYHAQFINNYRQLYGFTGSELTRNDFLKFSEMMDRHFDDYLPWLESCCKRCNIELMLTDRVSQTFNPHMESDYFRYVFRIDRLVMDVAMSAGQQKIVNKEALSLLNREEIIISGLPSYISYVDSVLEAVVAHDAVCLKVGLAYHRSIDFEKVDREEAERIFLLKNHTVEEKKALQDYVFHHIIQRSVDYGLTVQIHTGYLHGNRTMLDRGEPMKLLGLVNHYPDARFVLFHGGYPWTGDFIILGKNYPNVYLDLVWLPQLSRTAAIRVLHEMLDAVPYNKICWGGDVGYIDEAAGSLELGREVVATVLSERIDHGWITREVAGDIARRIFRENAIEIYGLEL